MSTCILCRKPDSGSARTAGTEVCTCPSVLTCTECAVEAGDSTSGQDSDVWDARLLVLQHLYTHLRIYVLSLTIW